MNEENPDDPVFTVFLSYSVRDRERLKSLKQKLRKGAVAVCDFAENEPLGAAIPDWIEKEIAEADCVLVVISANSQEKPLWIERELGLALTLKADKRSPDSPFIAIRLDCDGDTTFAMQPRNFFTREPIGPPIVWSNVNCLRLDKRGVAGLVQRLVKALRPQSTIIKRPAHPSQKSLFDSAMRLYRKALPIERERDTEENIQAWITRTWKGDGAAAEENWVNLLVVQHLGLRVIGIFWCNTHRPSGIGFVSFWGLLAAHRSFGRGMQFADGALCTVRALVPNVRGLLFAAERVDWRILDRVLEKASALWQRRAGLNPPAGAGSEHLDEPLLEGESALDLTVRAEAKERDWGEVTAQLRRFRRFMLFASGAQVNLGLPHSGFRIQGYVRRSSSQAGALLARTMADFMQPPIRLPIDPSSDSPLWLFALVSEGKTIPPETAIDWLNEVFFKETLGQGETELPGWNAYMVVFKRKWRELFVAEAELGDVYVGAQISRYSPLLEVVKALWIRQKALGEYTERFDIQL